MSSELTAATRVVHVIPHPDAGGMGEVAATVDRGMQRRGILSRVMDLQHELDQRGARGRKITPALVRFSLETVRHWRRQRPASVIAHTILAGVVTLSVARAAGVRERVLVVHANRALLGAPKTLLAQALWASRTATSTVFVGEAAAATFGWFGRASRTIIIRNGVQLAAAEDLPGSMTWASSTPDLVTVTALGRLVPEKAFDIAIRACQQAATPVTLTICGDGPERQHLEGLAEGEGHVRFLGSINRGQLRGVLQDTDICIFPSRVEGLPLALVEAAQTGVAVIAREDTVNREVLGESAIYVEGDRIEDWSAALDRLVSNPELMRRLQAEASTRAAAFDPEIMVERYIQMVGA